MKNHLAQGSRKLRTGPGQYDSSVQFCDMVLNDINISLQSMATATFGASANNMLKIHLNIEKKCSIKKQSGTAEVLRQAKLMRWDEADLWRSEMQ
ncbi:hypothetical protein Tco_1060588 [Tanacetum coccineum]